MAKVPETFNFGDNSEMDFEKLLVLLQRMYKDLALAVNSKPDLYQRDTDGQVGDTFLANGSLNLNLLTEKVEMLTKHATQTTVNWTQLS